ncbi:MAG: CDP-glycerol glycerophosphotransferase family protein, partial [Streptosporangiaceae bacterium]
PVSDAAAAEHGETIAVRPMFGLFPASRLEPYRTGIGRTGRGGNLAFRLVARSRSARAAWFGVRKLSAALPVARLLRAVRRRTESARTTWHSRAFKAAVSRTVLRRLPIRRGTVVFESHLGKQYSDSPRAIYEHLRATGVPMRPVWSYAGLSADGFPVEARLVRRDSWAYYRALAQAEFWIDNQGFPAEAVKRPGTTYIQTWHGSAFKRMGLHEPSMQLAPRAARARLARMVDRFDCFLVRSEHDVHTLAQGLGVRAELLPVGYPRNDALVTGGNPAKLDQMRRELGLTDGRRALLYAPTFRPGPGGRAQPLQLPFDPERFVRELGHKYRLLVRAHYLSAQPGLTTPCGTILDVSEFDDVTSLLLVSDALITDYSSIMFDFALLDRPMVFHAPDLENYARDRGSYFDLAERAPGPLTEDEDGLLETLAALEEQVEGYRPQRRRFVEDFGEFDSGTAAKAVAERFFAPGLRRG